MAPLHLGNPVNLALIGVGSVFAYFVGSFLYNIFLHPLRSFPGPLLWRGSAIPRYVRFWKGDLAIYVLELQKQYGPAVRIAPTEIAYVDAQAWKDIYGHRSQGQAEFGKSPNFFRLFKKSPLSILEETREPHGHQRRVLAHGFSDKSMKAQEDLIGGYVDLLISRLKDNTKGGPAVLNMRDWYNYTTFDVIGDLSMGSSFGCLESSNYHPWIKLINTSIRQSAMMTVVKGIFGSAPIEALYYLGGLALMKHESIVREKVGERMELGEKDRPDLIGPMINKQQELGMDFQKLCRNASLILLAGSETTATLLTGLTYMLVANPDKLANVVREVRESFESEDEITLLSVGKLSYMLGCLNEGLRHYPPVAAAMPRMIPRGGGTVLGKVLPEGTDVSVWQYAVNHREDYWADSMDFVPERWMNDPKYAHDVKDAMQAFSVGPRNCIGRNLAYAEMRLILAKILFNFDLGLDESSRGWINQKVFTIWDKPPLHIRLTPVVREKASLI